MFSQSHEPRTPYDIMARANPRVSRWANVAGGATYIGAYLVVRWVADSIESVYGIDVARALSLDNQYYIIPMFIYYGLPFFPSGLAYLGVLRWGRARFALGFAKDPRCYNCGGAVPGIMHDGSAQGVAHEVVSCPGCGAGCPVVRLEEGELLPVRFGSPAGASAGNADGLSPQMSRS